MTDASCLFLGTGASMGIPMIGCLCSVCQSKDPKDKRLRCSVLLKIGGQSILMDSSPDFRYQALRAGITSLNAVVWTHAHQDHTGGIDDLRPLFLHQKAPLSCYLSQATYDDLKTRFHYIVEPQKGSASIQPKLQFHILPRNGSIDFLGQKLQFFTYYQMGMEVLGFRIGTFAYVTDIKNVEPTLLERLKGVETLVVSALRYEPTPLHLTLDEAVAFGKKLECKNIYLTHIAHEIGAKEGQKRLPKGCGLAFDGLEISLKL